MLLDGVEDFLLGAPARCGSRRPENARTAATVSKSSGSAMASVRVESVSATGKTRHWRRKRCDRPSISGAEGGAPSTVTSGTPSWSESAASTSRWAISPMSTRILPSLSPRSRCSSSARSRSSASILPRSIRISPSRMVARAGRAAPRLGLGMRGRRWRPLIALPFRCSPASACVAVGLHHDLAGQPRGVFPGQIDTGAPPARSARSPGRPAAPAAAAARIISRMACFEQRQVRQLALVHLRLFPAALMLAGTG